MVVQWLTLTETSPWLDPGLGIVLYGVGDIRTGPMCLVRVVSGDRFSCGCSPVNGLDKEELTPL